jgi:hypothetical protein
MKPDFQVFLDEYISAMETEAQVDHKAFYDKNDGSHRAKMAIAILDGARQRLTPFVRA